MKTGITSALISEDSDLLVYGCQKVSDLDVYDMPYNIYRGIFSFMLHNQSFFCLKIFEYASSKATSSEVSSKRETARSLFFLECYNPGPSCSKAN